MAQRVIDLVISALAAALSVLLSWPYWHSVGYWAETPAMWTVYIVVGYVLAVYVFYAFLGSLRTLFLHDAQGHRPDAASQEKQS
ncbi:hypothetical protein ACMHYJ_02735 [Castellaniella hirudinis]|uniref:hypothetical protein n=1 Tax=Castellaniella hirudinis TaxID=1144617 RepID=UPI0039C3AFD3